jgi:hypothetical protein
MTTFGDELEVADEDAAQHPISFSGRFHFPEPSELAHPACFYTGIAFLVIFPLTGIIFHAVGASRLNSAKSALAGEKVTFSSPPATVIAFHWLFIIFISAGGALLFVGGRRDDDSKFFSGIQVGSFIVSIVWYGLYLYYYFKSSEFSASSNIWSLVAYEKVTEREVASLPFVRYEGYWEDLFYRCSIDTPISVYARSANDSSTIPNITHDVDSLGVILVKQQVKANWVPGEDSLIKITLGAIQGCTGYAMFDYTTYSISVDGFVSGSFVTRDGIAPGSLSKGAAIASGIFWAGIMHAYIVDAVPFVQVNIVKNDTLMGDFPNCGTVLQSVHCRYKSSTTRRY